MVTEKQEVAVLFARSDSIYKKFPDCDVWDIERDALMYTGSTPVVAHPMHSEQAIDAKILIATAEYNQSQTAKKHAYEKAIQYNQIMSEYFGEITKKQAEIWGRAMACIRNYEREQLPGQC